MVALSGGVVCRLDFALGLGGCATALGVSLVAVGGVGCVCVLVAAAKALDCFFS